MEKPISTNDSMTMIKDVKARKIQSKVKGKIPQGLADYLAKKKAGKATSSIPIKK